MITFICNSLLYVRRKLVSGKTFINRFGLIPNGPFFVGEGISYVYSGRIKKTRNIHFEDFSSIMKLNENYFERKTLQTPNVFKFLGKSVNKIICFDHVFDLNCYFSC